MTKSQINQLKYDYSNHNRKFPIFQRTIYIVIGSISFEKDYLSGKYGGIPTVGDLARLFNTQEE